MLIPFEFQKGNKAAGCEDAPPVTNEKFSVICDGLGGSGSIKHQIIEKDSTIPVNRTSGYLGSRIVAESVVSYYTQNYSQLEEAISQKLNFQYAVENFLAALKNHINNAFADKIGEYNIDTEKATKTLKIFPTTLASAIYFTTKNKMYILAIWAGDSRVYILSPSHGLQLLSLDDAKDAEDEMKSASEMENCISAGRSFRLNYALYEMDEPGIVFCCSDGCFDYIQTPLHFEWLLLQTILEYVPKAKNDDLGLALGCSIKDSMYQTIGDDTTMAGIIYGIESSSELKKCYKSRMDRFSHIALKMNDYVRSQKMVQSEKESAQKKCRLYESKVENEVRLTVCNTLRNKTPNLLYNFLIRLPFYSDFQLMCESINSKLDEKCTQELSALNEKLKKEKETCKEFLLRDYLRWRHDVNKSSQLPPQPQFPFFDLTEFMGLREKPNNERTFLHPENCRQPLKICIEAFRHPDFVSVVHFPGIPENDNEEYIQSKISQLETIITLLDNNDPLFLNLWSQAYFSTDRYEKKRFEYENSDQFIKSYELALQDPDSCHYMSNLTARKFAEYHNDANGFYNVQKKYANERTRQLNNVPESFFDKHKKEIIAELIKQPTDTIIEMFTGTNISADKFSQYINAKKILEEIDVKIDNAQKQVNQVWELYKGNYQLFKAVKEKGEV